MHKDKKDYIIVKDRHPRISEVLNDCVNLCVAAKKDESLASILQKICSKININYTTLQASIEEVVADLPIYVLEAGDNINVEGTGSVEDPWIVSSPPSTHYSYTSSDFEVDGITILDPSIDGQPLSIWLDAVGRFIYESMAEWQPVSGGFQILIPGFDAGLADYHLEVFIKTT